MKELNILCGSILPEVGIEPVITINRVEGTCDLHLFLSSQAKIELIEISLLEFRWFFNPYTRDSFDGFNLLRIIHTTKDNIWSGYNISYGEWGMFDFKEVCQIPLRNHSSKLSEDWLLHRVFDFTNNKETVSWFKCLDNFFLWLELWFPTSWSTHQKNIPLLAIEKRYVDWIVIIETWEVCYERWGHIYELLDVSGSWSGGSCMRTFWFAICMVCCSFGANSDLSRRSSQSLEAW